MAENGIMAMVHPHDVLFCGATKLHIRKYLIEQKNYLDAVIGLPAKIFYGTSIPTCILVFKKYKEDPDHILFIDASKDFEKVENQNILRDEHINKIVESYRNRTLIEKYSHLATLQEVAEDDYESEYSSLRRYV